MREINVKRDGFRNKDYSYWNVGGNVFFGYLRKSKDGAISSGFCIKEPQDGVGDLVLEIQSPSDPLSVEAVEDFYKLYDCNHLDIHTFVPITDDEALKIVTGEILPTAYNKKADEFELSADLIADDVDAIDRGFALYKIARLRGFDAASFYTGKEQSYFQAFDYWRKENAKKENAKK